MSAGVRQIARRLSWMVMVALGWASRAPMAHACGGCFGSASSNAPVVGHRMAFAISEGRTVLWDQFEYSGAPEEFSWVLPVAPGAFLEPSSNAWFDALEAYTQVTVAGPPLNCVSRDDESGCGSSDDAAIFPASDPSSSGPSVLVLRRETVGPYDTVTLRSTSGDALSGWLVQNGFVIPDDIRPVIAAYVSEGADFIALRLRPGAGVTQMTPVRVVTPGGTPILPLRMVAAGVAQWVNIVLFVIGEARYAMPDLPEVTVDLDALDYDFATNTTNYTDLRERVLARNDGHVFLTAHAGQNDFDGVSTGRTWQTTNSSGFASDLISLYFAEALESAGARPVDACARIASNANTDLRVVPGCEGVGCSVAPGELAASQLTCDRFDDVAAALIGQRPASTWLTRLELRLPREALSIDCVLQAHVDQVAVPSALTARGFTNPPCDLPLFSSSLSAASPRHLGVYLLFAATLGVFMRRAGKRHE